LTLAACTKPVSEDLPYIGRHDFVDGDTIHYKIPPFSFIDQDSVVVDNESLSDHIYVADFFFTYCPFICPKVTSQMVRVYEKFEQEDKLKLISHTLDPIRDTTEVLKNYAAGLGVDTDKWYFLTGDKDEIWDIAENYYVTVISNDEIETGIDHSGKLLLIDTNGHIRAFAEGTDPDSVTEFFGKIEQLLEEYRKKES